jgi:hypothetical protein
MLRKQLALLETRRAQMAQEDEFVAVERAGL